MARYGSDKVAFLLIDGYSVLGTTTTLTEDHTAKMEETTPLGAADETYDFTGITSSKMSQQGYFDDAAGSSNDALVSGNGSKRVICYGVEGNTAGKQFVGFAGALQTTYKREAKKGALHRASADYTGSGAKEDGRIVHAHGTETTATGNTQGSSVDNAAASTNGGAVYLQLSYLILDTYTSFQVVMQDSADNVTFADIAGASFAANTSSPAAQRLSIAGTIRRYTCCRWVFSGSGSGQSAQFMAGIVRD